MRQSSLLIANEKVKALGMLVAISQVADEEWRWASALQISTPHDLFLFIKFILICQENEPSGWAQLTSFTKTR